jgi:hypothetical protein
VEGEPLGGLSDSDLPALYHAADKASRIGRRNYIRIAVARLTLLVLGATFGAFAFTWRHTDIIAFVVVVLISAGFLMQRDHLQGKSWMAWREGEVIRARVASLAWRYAVGASPFSVAAEPGAEEEAEDRLRDAQARLLEHASPGSVTAEPGAAISEGMRTLRGATLEQRKRAYLTDRVAREQQKYRDLVRRERRRMSRLWVTFSVLEFLCVCTAIVRGLDLISFNLPGILAAVVAVGAVWLNVKQYDKLVEDCTFASNRLNIHLIGLDRAVSEREWVREAGNAEDIISGEYTKWHQAQVEFQPF